LDNNVFTRQGFVATSDFLDSFARLAGVAKTRYQSVVKAIAAGADAVQDFSEGMSNDGYN
jgi:hypothetical protein